VDEPWLDFSPLRALPLSCNIISAATLPQFYSLLSDMAGNALLELAVLGCVLIRKRTHAVGPPHGNATPLSLGAKSCCRTSTNDTCPAGGNAWPPVRAALAASWRDTKWDKP
jgi:hypothetical protein